MTKEQLENEELKMINAGINDIWRMIKKYLPDASNDEQYWSGLNDACRKIDEKYHNALLQRIMMAVLGYIDEKTLNGETQS